MASARVRLPDSLETMLRSEMEYAIKEANLGEFDTGIAKRYLIDQWPQIDIAAELGTNRGTVSAHVARILKKVEHTVKRLSITNPT